MSQALPPPGHRSAVSNAVDAASPASKLSAMRSATARARRSSLTSVRRWAALLGGRPSSMGDPNNSKQNKAKANKNKQNCLHLLAFILPNPDFSRGYGGKNKKILCPFSSSAGVPPGAGLFSDEWLL